MTGEFPGASKLEKIKVLKLKTLDEDSLLDLIRDKPSQEEYQMPEKLIKEAQKLVPKVISEGLSDSAPIDNIQWTEKYKPTKSKDLCGNKTPVDNLRKFLQEW